MKHSKWTFYFIGIDIEDDITVTSEVEYVGDKLDDLESHELEENEEGINIIIIKLNVY